MAHFATLIWPTPRVLIFCLINRFRATADQREAHGALKLHVLGFPFLERFLSWFWLLDAVA